MQRRLMTITAMTRLLLLLTEAAHGQNFLDDFEDGNLFDGEPVVWEILSGNVSAGDGDMLLTRATGQQFVVPVVNQFHEDVLVEMTMAMPESRMKTSAIVRDTRNGGSDGYWAGMFRDGELLIGYGSPSEGPVTAKGGVFLPNSPVPPGIDVSFQVSAIGNTIKFTAWETSLGPQFAVTNSWTATRTQYPTGNLVYPSLSPLGSNESVRVREFGATFANDAAADFNGDGATDGGDFLQWQRGEPGMPHSRFELDRWQSYFGASAAVSADSPAVAEPSTWGIACVALGLGFVRRPRLSRSFQARRLSEYADLRPFTRLRFVLVLVFRQLAVSPRVIQPADLRVAAR